MADDRDIQAAQQRAAEARRKQEPLSEAVQTQALEAANGQRFAMSSAGEPTAPTTPNEPEKTSVPPAPAVGLSPVARTSVTNAGTPPPKASQQMRPNPYAPTAQQPSLDRQAQEQPNPYAPRAPEPEQEQEREQGRGR